MDDEESLFVALGPLLIAIAAAFAAWLAAHTANKRQQEQLDHDSRRHREQLDHDRKMRYLAHVRDALDGAVELVQEMLGVVTDYELSVKRYEKKRLELEAVVESSDRDDDEEEEARSRLRDSLGELAKSKRKSSDKIEEMFAATARLRLRLGPHAIVEKYDALRQAWIEFERSLDIALNENRDETQLTESDRLDDEAGDAYSSLMVECESWFTRLGADSASMETADSPLQALSP